MIAYLKKVLSHSAYETFIASNDYITPNVSYDTEHVHYNPYVAPISITASVGDILWSDLSVTSTATPTGSGVTPIGICCIASDDTNTDDGKARFIGLKYMTTSGPSTAQYPTTLAWGPSNTPIPNIHSGPDYVSTDYDGEGNTAAIVATGNLASYPAANACQSYAPTGTSAGDWYLPATKELKEVFANKTTIINQLTALQTNYSSDCISDIKIGAYWSSTQYDENEARIAYSQDSSIARKDKKDTVYVLPMLKL